MSLKTLIFFSLSFYIANAQKNFNWTSVSRFYVVHTVNIEKIGID